MGMSEDMMNNKAKASQLKHLIKMMGKKILDGYEDEEQSEKPMMKAAMEEAKEKGPDDVEYEEMDMGDEDIKKMKMKDSGDEEEYSGDKHMEKMMKMEEDLKGNPQITQDDSPKRVLGGDEAPEDATDEEVMEDKDQDELLAERKQFMSGKYEGQVSRKSMKLKGSFGDEMPRKSPSGQIKNSSKSKFSK